MAVNVQLRQMRTLLENDRVKVSEFRQKPGEKTGMHEHPEVVVYPFTDGVLRFTFRDGRTEDVQLRTGEVLFRSDQWHDVENIGKREVRALTIDLKK